MVTVLKLGGSVITVKSELETIDESALKQAASAVGNNTPTDLIIVHGGGSFGHHHADTYGVSVTRGTHDVTAVAEVHGAMCQLNEVVISALQAASVEAVPVHPFSLARRGPDGDLELPVGGLSTMLDEGFVPVLHGDVVPQAGAGVTILSGDEIVVSIAESLSADRVGLCSTVPGILDASGDVIHTISSMTDVADALDESEVTDVTGGMTGKVRSLLSLSTSSHVFNLDELSGFLTGKSPGTEIHGQ